MSAEARANVAAARARLAAAEAELKAAETAQAEAFRKALVELCNACGYTIESDSYGGGPFICSATSVVKEDDFSFSS